MSIRNNLISFENLSTRIDFYNEVDFGGKIGTSDCNEYVPFYVILNHRLIDINGHRIIEYGKPSYRNFGRYSRNYNELFDGLRGLDYSRQHHFTITGETHSLGYTRHILHDSNNNILFTLAIKRDALLNNTFAQLQANQNASDYILIVNNELFSNPIYKNLAKKVNNAYIAEFKASNIDIVYTNDVDKWLYNNNFTKPEFKNAIQMMNHLNKEVPKILIES